MSFWTPLFDIDMTKMHKNAHYLNERLEKLQIEDKDTTRNVVLADDDGKQTPFTVTHFSPQGQDIRIHYHDLDGMPMFSTRKRTSSFHASSEFTEAHYRLRLNPNKVTPDSPKYIQPRGTKLRPYLNGLLQFYSDAMHRIETVYLSEGEFKAFVGCMHDVPTIGAGGINAFYKTHRDKFDRVIKNEFLPEIVEALDRMPNLERIVLLHDSDALDGSEERRNSFFHSVRAFSYCVKEYNHHRGDTQRPHIQSEYWKNEHPTFKGLDDLLNGEQHSVDDFIGDLNDFHTKHVLYKPNDKGADVLERFRMLRQWFGLRIGVHRVDFDGATFNVQRWLSESKVKLTEAVNVHPRLLIQAPTGSGKTYTFLKEILPARLTANPYERIAFVVPTKALAENICAEYDLPLVHGDIQGDELLWAYKSNLFVTTLDSAPKMGIVDTIVIDEAHVLTRDFRTKAKQGVEDLMNKAERTILLTGTPTALWKDFGYSLIKVNQTSAQKRPVKVHKLNEKQALKNVLTDIVHTVSKADKGLVSVVRHNNKTQLKNVREMALKHGLFNENEVVYIDSSDENKGVVYESITSKSMIPDGVRLVLMTSLMDEGVNINNTNIEGIHFVQDKIAGDLRDENAIQFVSRFRKWFGTCNLYVKEDDRQLVSSWHPRTYIEQQQKAANHELEAMRLRGEDKTQGENIIRTHAEKNHLQWSEIRGCWMVSQSGLITTTLLFFARRLPVAEYINQLRESGLFDVTECDYLAPYESEANEFRDEVKGKAIEDRLKRKALRDEFDRVITSDPRGVIASFYRYYAKPFDKKTIKSVWHDVELWEPAYSYEVGLINEVHTVFSYIYDVAKLCKNGLTIEDAVCVYLRWYNTRAFKLMCASFEFAHVIGKHQKGERISSRDRQLAHRIDSVRMALIDIQKQGRAVTIQTLKNELIRKNVRARLDDLKLWVDMVAQIESATVKGRRGFKVVKVLEMSDYLARFKRVQKVGYFLSDSARNCTPQNKGKRSQNQRVTRTNKKVICSLTISPENGRKNGQNKRRKQGQKNPKLSNYRSPDEFKKFDKN